MTTITVYTFDGGRLCGFEAAGHAGAKRIRGYDLVCCAVSALTQTGVNALCQVAGVEPKVEVKDGYDKGTIVSKLIENGLLVLTAGPGMRLLPPLVITKEEMDQGLAIMKKTLG